jgi:hypothetical protein
MAGKQSRQERVAELIAGVREAATGAVERSSAIGLPTIDPSVYDGIISPAELQERQPGPGSKRKKSRGRPTDKTIPQRDKDIYAKSKDGVCHGEIADQYDLRQKYVGQIVRQQRKKAEKSTR